MGNFALRQVEEADADRPNSETDANMATMFKILSERKSVQVDHMVLNRVSFAQTIENLFALSFLVKDGRVEYKFSEDGIQSVGKYVRSSSYPFVNPKPFFACFLSRAASITSSFRVGKQFEVFVSSRRQGNLNMFVSSRGEGNLLLCVV